MSQPSRKEHPGTYFVQDRSNIDERDRVHIQDAMITNVMGGPLPEQTNPGSLRRVIDIGCGCGGWLIEVAKAYPDIELLIGIDISHPMIEYARELAQAEHVDKRVEFHVMDAPQFIAFPQHYFDLVNHRLGLSYLRTWDWPNLITKYQYITQPGGVIRITESAIGGTSTSPALTQLYTLECEAFYRAGHLFTPDRNSIIDKLPELFRHHGLKDIQTRTSLLEYRPGSGKLESFYDDVRLLFRTILPFLRKWGHTPANYDEIYQQALYEMQQPGCLTTWQLVTIWGSNN